MNIPPFSERAARFSGIPNIDTLQRTKVAIAGVGAIGRQVAVTLAAMGAEDLTFIDPDVVTPSNLGTQGWLPSQLGIPKVYACSDACIDINPQLATCAHQVRLEECLTDLQCDILYLCVDNMATRNHVAETLSGKWHPRLIIDTRAALYAGRVIVDSKAPGFPLWCDSLFTDEEAHEAPCTLRMTFFTAQILGGFAAKLCIDFLKDSDFLPSDTTFDLLGHAMIPTPKEATALEA